MQGERDGEKPSKRALGFTKPEPGDLEPRAGHSTGAHTTVWGLQTRQTQASCAGCQGAPLSSSEILVSSPPQNK